MIGFDTETTGVDTFADRIVEGALVYREIESDSLEDTLDDIIASWLIDPGVKIPLAAQKVNHLTNEIVKKCGVQPKTALEEIANSICNAANQGYPLVIYNAEFDLGILNNELRRYELPTLNERLGRGLCEVLDPYALDIALDPYRQGSRSLLRVAESYGVQVFGNVHRASIDAQIALDLLQAIIVKYPELKALTFKELFEFQEQGIKQVLQDPKHLHARKTHYKQSLGRKYSNKWI